MRSQNFLPKVAKYFRAICLLCFVVSCAATEEDFAISKTAPTYYSQPPRYQSQPYQQPYQPPQYQQPQYQQVPPQQYYYPQQPAYYPPVTPYPQQGGSRYYSNPYAIPPSTQYPNYDADQYYVPPTYYNKSDSQTQQTQQQILSNTGTF